MKCVPAYMLSTINLLLVGTLIAADSDPISFNRDVRPILSDRCYACHGPDEHSREADLRLDQRESAVDSGAIVPGEADESELIARINSDDADILMPPPKLHKPLTSREKQVLVRWIEQGAKYEQHWSFVPPRREAVPSIRNTDWPRNPIDHFILAHLEGANLAPSPEANRETLIRRVTLDLTGLPPTLEEVDAFVHDTREDAYERLVARLMKTTSYAERRAQDWLDLARYADTRGYADDKMRVIWPWRDWVIRSIDRNMPFDEFTIHQLAGDMLPDATDDSRLATAFHRNAPQASGETYPVEEFRIAGVIDRVNTIGRVWLGLTMDCVQCHDHKFDPISQRDYYSMLAIFNNIEHSGTGYGQGGPTMSYRPRGKSTSVDPTEIEKLRTELAAARRDLPKPRAIDEKRFIGKWDGPTVEPNPEAFCITGNLTITAKIQTSEHTADIISKYDWRGKQRSYVFGIGGEGDPGSAPGHLFFWVSSSIEPFSGVTVYGSYPVNDGEQHLVAVEFVSGSSVRLFVDGIEDKAARVEGVVPKSIAVSNRPLAIGSGYSGSETADTFRFKGDLSDVRISDQALGDDISVGGAGDKVMALLAALKQMEDRQSEQEVIAAVPVMVERTEPRETFIHVRGNFLARGDRVYPAVPSLFDIPKNHQPRNRLEFARWLVDGKNPLVARVVVNRFWQSYFGNGLVRTPDDFGAQGTPATHPRLLDWLATEFVESGWDMKHIHQLIVNSATYRQSARVTPASLKTDPENSLLARMSRVRLPAEQIRDQALAISGLLANKVGGPPVYPTQPDGYWQQRVLPGEWKNSSGDDRHRKTMYTYWRRMALHPTLELLNAPARDNCVVQRDMANIPTQALVLLNDPIFHEAAIAFAWRLIREVKGDDTQRLELAFRLALGRRPKPAEQTRFLSYLARQREEIRKDAATTRALAGSDSVDAAVWTLACSVILNLDESITRP